MKYICAACIGLAIFLMFVAMVAVELHEIVLARVLVIATAVLMYGAWESSKRVKE